MHQRSRLQTVSRTVSLCLPFLLIAPLVVVLLMLTYPHERIFNFDSCSEEVWEMTQSTERITSFMKIQSVKDGAPSNPIWIQHLLRMGWERTFQLRYLICIMIQKPQVLSIYGHQRSCSMIRQSRDVHSGILITFQVMQLACTSCHFLYNIN